MSNPTRADYEHTIRTNVTLLIQPDTPDKYDMDHIIKAVMDLNPGATDTIRITREDLDRILTEARKPTCEVFLLCENPATTTIPNPILGEVPSCESCKAKMTTLENLA